MGLLADTRPLREVPAFRRLWAGTAVSAVGSQMTSFAVALQVFTLTQSSVAVGGVSLAGGVPALVLGLLGGSVVDVVDRRRLVLVTSSGLAAVSVVFAVQSVLAVDQLWLLYVLAGAQGVLGSVDGPARRTFLGRVLPADRVPAGAALNLLVFHLAVTAGPALAGVIAGFGGLRTCYLLDAVSFTAALYGVARLPPMPPEDGVAPPGLRAVTDGLRFIRAHKVIAGTLLADVNATVLGMPFALFPAINAARFGGHPETLGLLTSAVAVGGLLGSGLSGPTARITRQGRAMLLAGAVWGAALAGVGLTRSLWPALLLLTAAGAADATAVVLRSAVLQTATPDRYRGRVSAAEYVVGVGCPQLGNFRAGAVGSPPIGVSAGSITVLDTVADAGVGRPGKVQAGAMWDKRADMVVHQEDPYNAEPPRAALAGEVFTGTDTFYSRNHGPIPVLDRAGWRLRVDGLVERPLSVDLAELRERFTEHQLPATLQCAGNRREGFLPIRDIPGEAPWGSGATSTATWAGVRLADVLAAAGPAEGAAHAAFTAPDVSQIADPVQSYGSSIPLAKAMSSEVLLAWSMNGQPLIAAHGAPLRVVVPGFIGARSVKWLQTITVQDQPSDNWFQATAYRVLPAEADPLAAGPGDGISLAEVALNAEILSPDVGATLAAGPVEVRGYAFAGGGRGVGRVDVSADGGVGWVQADLGVDRGPWVWRQWTARVDVTAGDRMLTARAWDTAGASMPEDPRHLWNPKGYVNNSWARVPVHAR